MTSEIFPPKLVSNFVLLKDLVPYFRHLGLIDSMLKLYQYGNRKHCYSKKNTRNFLTFFYNSFSIEKKKQTKQPIFRKETRMLLPMLCRLLNSNCLSYLSSVPCLASEARQGTLLSPVKKILPGNVICSRKMGRFVFFFRLKTNSKRKL